MRKQFLAGTTALALAIGMTTSAMAFEDGGGLHAGIGGSHSGFHSRRFEGVRGFSGWRRGDWGSRQFDGGYGGRGYGGPYYHGHPTDLGPLGFSFGPATPYGYAPGTSIAAWSY
jgi:hypothetical protein